MQMFSVSRYHMGVSNQVFTISAAYFARCGQIFYWLVCPIRHSLSVSFQLPARVPLYPKELSITFSCTWDHSSGWLSVNYLLITEGATVCLALRSDARYCMRPWHMRVEIRLSLASYLVCSHYRCNESVWLQFVRINCFAYQVFSLAHSDNSNTN